MFSYVWYFLASETIDVILYTAWFWLGVGSILDDRRNGHRIMSEDDIKDEDSLGFGQLVPILMLLVPILQILESYACKSIEHQIALHQSLTNAARTQDDQRNEDQDAQLYLLF
jgi:hypothetical protein